MTIGTPSIEAVTASLAYAPNRSSERAEDLMIAALDLFAERDIANVTIKDIAAAANVNSALIYYYFDDKTHLFRAALAYAARKTIANYRTLEHDHDHPAELIHAWFQNNLKLSEPIRQLVKIMLDYNSTATRAFSISDLVDQFYQEEETSILANNIQRGIDMGLFEPVDARKMAHFISIHLDGIMVASLIRVDFDLSESMAHLEEFLWSRLRYDIGTIRLA